MSKAHCGFRRSAPLLNQLALPPTLWNCHFLLIDYVAPGTKIPRKEISEFPFELGSRGSPWWCPNFECSAGFQPTSSRQHGGATFKSGQHLVFVQLEKKPKSL